MERGQIWSAPRYNYGKAADTTFVASNFPCGSADYTPDSVAYPPLKVTSCCLPEFLDMSDNPPPPPRVPKRCESRLLFANLKYPH